VLLAQVLSSAHSGMWASVISSTGYGFWLSLLRALHWARLRRCYVLDKPLPVSAGCAAQHAAPTQLDPGSSQGLLQFWQMVCPQAAHRGTWASLISSTGYRLWLSLLRALHWARLCWCYVLSRCLHANSWLRRPARSSLTHGAVIAVLGFLTRAAALSQGLGPST
jgi:hypothetical protein